jgi:hypothetical protein
MLVKRMLLGVKLGIGIQIQRRHPLRTTLVEFIWELDKPLDLGFVPGVDILDGEHKNS